MTEKILNLVKRGYKIEIRPGDVPDEINIVMKFNNAFHFSSIRLNKIDPKFINEALDYHITNGARAITEEINRRESNEKTTNG